MLFILYDITNCKICCPHPGGTTHTWGVMRGNLCFCHLNCNLLVRYSWRTFPGQNFQFVSCELLPWREIQLRIGKKGFRQTFWLIRSTLENPTIHQQFPWKLKLDDKSYRFSIFHFKFTRVFWLIVKYSRFRKYCGRHCLFFCFSYQVTKFSYRVKIQSWQRHNFVIEMTLTG